MANIVQKRLNICFQPKFHSNISSLLQIQFRSYPLLFIKSILSEHLNQLQFIPKKKEKETLLIILSIFKKLYIFLLLAYFTLAILAFNLFVCFFLSLSLSLFLSELERNCNAKIIVFQHFKSKSIFHSFKYSLTINGFFILQLRKIGAISQSSHFIQ